MSGVQHPVWLAGLYRVINLDDPPPGQNFVVQVPTLPEGVYWRVKSITCRLVTAAGGATRRVTYGLSATPLDPATLSGGDLRPLYLVVSSNLGFAAATTADLVSAEVGQTSTGQQIQVTWPLDVKVQPGHFICSAFGGLQPTDQVSAVRLFIQEYIYVPPVDAISGLPDALKQLADSQLEVHNALLAIKAGGAPT